MIRRWFVKTRGIKNKRFEIVVSAAALAAISLFISIVSFAGQVPKVPREVWIAVRTDNQSGTGTIVDPYDGSSQVKFDAVVADGTKTPADTHIHLGPGTFHTDAQHTWTVRNGWTVQGTGMYQTIVQVDGAPPSYGAQAFNNPYNDYRENITIRDLTIDCNWGRLANAAPNGATVRTFTNTSAVSSSPTIPSTNGAFTQMDAGRVITGTGIPANSWIGVVNSPTSIGISSSAVSNVPVNATIPSGMTITISEKFTRAMAAGIGGNNNTYDHVRAIHAYGSNQNGQECFVLSLGASFTKPTREFGNNHMRYCLVEKCYGNYATPFALGGARGSPSYPDIVNPAVGCSVEFCTAIGERGIIGYSVPGSVTPFTSGGVNLADVKDMKIHGNTFIDCGVAAYQDTGGFDGIEISNNTVIRGATGAAFVVHPPNFPGATFKNLKIINNIFGIERKILGGANYGIIIREVDCSPVIDGNTITYDISGPGNNVFWPFQVQGTGGTIINNVVDLNSATLAAGVYVGIGDACVVNGAPDSRYTLYNNRTLAGTTIAGMSDTAVIEWVVMPWGRGIGRVKLPLIRKPE
jgi:hypothetical protein